MNKDIKSKRKLTENPGFNILRLLVNYQNFFPPQVKRSMIISNKHDMYELPNGLRLKILGNWGISRKPLNFIEL